MGGTVSVIVPCFNLGEFLAEAVDSALAQTREVLEIVVIDDGSTDPATRRILDAFSRPRTTVLRPAHAGLAAARNLGLAQARGDYVCALDADDVLAPTYVERTAKRLDSDPGLAFVSTWQRTFGTEEWDWKRDRCDLVQLLAEDTVHTAALARRSAVAEVGGWDGAMPAMGYEDWDLWLSLVERGFRGEILPETLFFYRRRPGSMFFDCTAPETHLALVEYLVKKHAASYEKHLVDVLALKEAEAARVLAGNYRVESELAIALEPMRRGLEGEFARLRERRAKLEGGDAALRRRIAELENAVKNAESEIAALRTSKSWQVTAPLRAAWDAVRRVKGKP